MKILALRAAACGLAVLPALACAQQRPDPAALQAAQREAMQAFARLDGVWRGTATSTLPSGEKHVITQTERVGPFLGGTLRVVEGRGYEPDGRVGFNAFAIVSYDPVAKAYTTRSYTMGRQGDFPWTPTADGFTWEVPAGPGATVRYTATVKDNTWHEVGDRIVAGKEPQRIFEMTLQRVGDTDWPAAGAVSQK